MKHVLFLPTMIVLLATTGCTLQNQDGVQVDLGYECSTDTHLILMACSMFVLLLLILLSLTSITLFADEQPDSTLPWAYCSRLIDLYKFLRKLLLAFGIFLTSIYEGIGAVLVLLLIVLTGLCIYELYKQAFMNNRHVYYALITTEGAVGWISGATLLQMVLGIDWSSPIVLFIFSIILLVGSYVESRKQTQLILMTSSFSKFRDAIDVETYCRILLDSISDNRQASKVTLETVIAIHSLSCTRPLCICKKLTHKIEELQDIKKTQSDSECLKKVAESYDIPMKKKQKEKEFAKGMPESNENEVIKKRKTQIQKLLIEEVTGWNNGQEHKAKLHIYLAYLKLQSYENQLCSLYELMCAQESAPNIYEEFIVYRMMYFWERAELEFRQRIELQLVKKDGNQQTQAEIDNLIIFQQILTEMQESMAETLKLYIGFWKELQDESPNFQYIGNMSHDISNLAAKIRANYRQLISVNPTNLYCRMLYALFLKKIIKDEFEAFDVYDQYFSLSNFINATT